jgi:hypothetical protein
MSGSRATANIDYNIDGRQSPEWCTECSFMLWCHICWRAVVGCQVGHPLRRGFCLDSVEQKYRNNVREIQVVLDYQDGATGTYVLAGFGTKWQTIKLLRLGSAVPLSLEG